MTQIFASDGHTRFVTPADIVQGTVVRRYADDGALDSFSDCVIVGVVEKDGETIVELGRPYLYARKGEGLNQPLMGYERFTVFAKRLVEKYSVVLLSTGRPVRSIT